MEAESWLAIEGEKSMNRCLAGFLVCSMLVVSGVRASDNWVQLNNTHGWSITYPASWEAYVMQAPDSGPDLCIRKSEDVNFDGPRGCYDKDDSFNNVYLFSECSDKSLRRSIGKEICGRMGVAQRCGFWNSLASGR